MNIEDVINHIDKNPKLGLQLTKSKGLLTSTWVIYKRRKNYYFFDICETFVFDKYHRYTRDELISEFKNSIFEIDDDFL